MHRAAGGGPPLAFIRAGMKMTRVASGSKIPATWAGTLGALACLRRVSMPSSPSIRMVPRRWPPTRFHPGWNEEDDRGIGIQNPRHTACLHAVFTLDSDGSSSCTGSSPWCKAPSRRRRPNRCDLSIYPYSRTPYISIYLSTSTSPPKQERDNDVYNNTGRES